MPSEDVRRRVFQSLRGILEGFEPRLVVRTNDQKTYYLEARGSGKERVFFGSASIKKNYVSYHLMPVYDFPDLLDCVSPELRARMQGKSCFNFKKEEPDLVDELAGLTRAGFDRFEKEGLVR